MIRQHIFQRPCWHRVFFPRYPRLRPSKTVSLLLLVCNGYCLQRDRLPVYLQRQGQAIESKGAGRRQHRQLCLRRQRQHAPHWHSVFFPNKKMVSLVAVYRLFAQNQARLRMCLINDALLRLPAGASGKLTTPPGIRGRL